jgi:hypothetical protein
MRSGGTVEDCSGHNVGQCIVDSLWRPRDLRVALVLGRPDEDWL